MLLRALELHARLAHHRDSGREKEITAAVQKDGYLGLYISCTRLLDLVQEEAYELHEPYARLFLAYTREAIRALRHLQDIERSAIAPGHHRILAAAIAQVIIGSQAVLDVDSESALEGLVIGMLASLERREVNYSTTMHPASAFPRLGEAIKSCVPGISGLKVLFLLDDVSTRHLDQASIGKLLSGLMFSAVDCAFKMTTETQTLEMVLQSPALIEKARDRRDYSVFDLGAAVNDKLRSRTGGKKFISNVLYQRVQLAVDQPHGLRPEQRLGDSNLEEIARGIAVSAETSGNRKRVYRGISALTAVCVGDIGDVITLYEMMTSRAGTSAGITPEIQSTCYQEYCSRRLYNVNRRDGSLKDFALTFAQASHELLVRSVGKKERRGLRQYSSIYVRLTAGDVDRQMARLRDLIDSGVFVLESGADTPRTKTRDADPIHQFILTFRKLFGLSSYIGLADRDRFELSGQDLQEWLEHPDRGKEILIRHLTGPHERIPGTAAQKEIDQGPLNHSVQTESDSAGDQIVQQATLDFKPLGSDNAVVRADGSDRWQSFVEEHGPRVRRLQLGELTEERVDQAVIGLGFEERTAASVQRLLSVCRPKAALAIRYKEAGRADVIRAMLASASIPLTEVAYQTTSGDHQSLRHGSILVDITGLAKPALFSAVRGALQTVGRVLVVHTAATQHYPLDEDIGKVFEADEANDVYALLQRLDRVWSGEEGPYRFVRLLPSRVDDSKSRVLLASASPKHQRLLSLLDHRPADVLELLHPSSTTPRGRLATFAAEIAKREREGSRMEEVDSNDLVHALKVLGKLYYWWYVERGSEFEVALTGSKVHAVAAAAASVAYRISQCWYVGPARFDPLRFTEGVGETDVMEVTLPPKTPD
jgi:hypothetical protein